jgi:hypothetical protein
MTTHAGRASHCHHIFPNVHRYVNRVSLTRGHETDIQPRARVATPSFYGATSTDVGG